ncbi:hypothetical protein GHT06_015380 [Daphnia sinensis]|uniref:Uncharacterized protein n=1 Tax=Daphnia sinensis TaxID=1820382 RepID=A0AAD5KT86_9CRUS|nr:hypothetical protein GHT06_015380 [Daphnia sinensis]
MSPVTELGVTVEVNELMTDEVAKLSVVVEGEVVSLTLVIIDIGVVSIVKIVLNSLASDGVVVISVDSVLDINGVLVSDSVMAVGIEDDSLVSVIRLTGLSVVSPVVVDRAVFSVVSVSEAVDIAAGVVSMLVVDVNAISVCMVKTVGVLGVDPDVGIDKVSVAPVIEIDGFEDADDVPIFGVVGVVVPTVVVDEEVTVELVTGRNS